MAGYKYTDGVRLSEDQIADRIAPAAVKLAWFLQRGYSPHYWQTLFHTAWRGVTAYADEDPSLGLSRYRHLVAGRRGGKTMSAAWEVAFYMLHPEEFHWDYHRVRSDRPLYGWVVTKDFPTGHAALTWFRDVLKAAGMTNGVEYRENRTNKWFEFENGSFLHFRSAEDPESLRGAGLDILWMDEAAMIPDARAYRIARPATSEKLGMVITTTTPQGKNWLYEEFWGQRALANPSHMRVEYRSIDNPYFPQEEWEELLVEYHPQMFKQEYMASFDAMSGIELYGEWLKYYTPDELPRVKDAPTKLDLDVYIGIDPAISLSEEADRWAAAVIGVTKDKSQAYLLDIYADRIPFPEQIEKIEELHQTWRPMFIGIESVAFQRSIEQQALRTPGFLPIVPMFAKGKKWERIMSMAPTFRTGRIKIQKTQYDFINEWLDYDSKKSNPKDDCLDAVEIALRTAGALLPQPAKAPSDFSDYPPATVEEWVARDRPGGWDNELLDEHFGGEW